MAERPPPTVCPTSSQLTEFRRGREAGRISLFRATACLRCQAEVPRGYTFCTRACQEKDAKEKAVTIIINLDSIMQGEHVIETKDGSRRTGKITKINWVVVAVNDKEHKFPLSVEMNNDAGDFITWSGVQSIKRAESTAE